mmetsp:Transcript_119220/g.186060  ORF Transcript_119220/g.186060 Transcript_119220/m.186060 type:complete len:524 (-) Transcript_119220:152-1723(-)
MLHRIASQLYTVNQRQVTLEGSRIISRCLVSERFVVKQNGEQVQFISRKTDADVLNALQCKSSAFAQSLLRKGQEGRWSEHMRAWAHFMASSREDSKDGEPIGNVDTSRASAREDSKDQEPIEHIDTTLSQDVVVRVDSRERKLIAHIHEHDATFPIVVETLRVGDVIIGSKPNEILIERKSMQDLVSSVFDMRLYNQVGNKLQSLKYERFRSCIIVEGSFEQLKDMKHGPLKRLPYFSKRQVVLKTIARLSLRDQIPVLRSDDIAGTFELIRTLVQEYPRLCRRPQQYSTRIDKPFRPRRGEDPKNVLADQLRCLRGVSLRVACQLAGKHTNISAFLADMGKSDDPVQWLIDRCQGGDERLNRPAAVLLAEALGGDHFVSHEKFIGSLVAVPGISRKAARTMANSFPDETSLREALETDSCAPEPVRRAIHLANMDRPAARRLVSKLFDSNALAWDDLIQQVAIVPGVSNKKAEALVDHFGGSKARLLDALQTDISMSTTQKRGAETGLRHALAEKLLCALA